MSSLTITVDEQLLRVARVKAVRQGTSVNEICRQAIATFAFGDGAAEGVRARARADAFWALSDSVAPGARPAGRPSREAWYEELLAQKSAPSPT